MLVYLHIINGTPISTMSLNECPDYQIQMWGKKFLTPTDKQYSDTYMVSENTYMESDANQGECHISQGKGFGQQDLPVSDPFHLQMQSQASSKSGVLVNSFSLGSILIFYNLSKNSGKKPIYSLEDHFTTKAITQEQSDGGEA